MNFCLSFDINFILFSIKISIGIRFFYTKLMITILIWKIYIEIKVNSYYLGYFSITNKRDKC